MRGADILVTGFSDFGAQHETHQSRQAMQFLTAADLLAKLLAKMGHDVYRGVPAYDKLSQKFDMIVITCISPASPYAKHTKEMIECLQHPNVLLLMDDRRVKKHIAGLAQLPALNKCSNRKFKMLCTTISNDMHEMQQVLDDNELQNITAVHFNPTSIMFDVLGVRTMSVPDAVFTKKKQWLCTSLPDITETIRQKYNFTWPVKYYNKTNFKSELQLCSQDYQDSFGMIVDFTEDTISNWWRTRYVYAMMYDMLLLTDPKDIQAHYDAFSLAKYLDFIETSASAGYLRHQLMQQKLHFLSHAPTMTALVEQWQAFAFGR